MRRRLVRAALLLYPAVWRRRYGGELEQLMIACVADRPSFLASARLLADLAGSGLTQRFRRYRASTRILTVACLCAAAGMAVDATTLSSTFRGQDFAMGQIGSIRLGPDTVLPANVSLISAQPWEFPSSFAPQPSRISVELIPGTSRVVGVSGPPATVTIDPETGQIVAVKPGGQ